MDFRQVIRFRERSNSLDFINDTDMIYMYQLTSEVKYTNEPRHAIMCLREINYVMRYDVVKSDVFISRRA